MRLEQDVGIDIHAVSRAYSETHMQLYGASHR